VTGDCHAGICGSLGVKFPQATRLRKIFHVGAIKSFATGKVYGKYGGSRGVRHPGFWWFLSG